MAWIRHQLQLLGLFIVGAAIPLGGVALLLAAGLLMFTSITGLVLGAFLLSNGIYGLAMSFKSFPMPVGRKLDAGNAPELVEKLDELAVAWKGPRSKELMLDPSFWTLDLVGVPTLGLLGWPRFQWLVGVQPMLALSRREFETIASWELVWWCDQQSWLNLQVKRLTAYWTRLSASFQQSDPSPSPLRERWSRAFLKPYARWVNRRFESFLIHELVRTDAIIAHQFGSSTLARALCRLAFLRPLMDCRVFAEWDRTLKQGLPLPEHPYAHVLEILGRWPEGAEGLLELALDGLVPEAPPLLKLRLEQLGEEALLPLPVGASSAVKLLEDGGVLAELEQEWSGSLRALAAEAQRNREAKDLRFQELQKSLGQEFPGHPDSREYLRLAALRMPMQEFIALAESYLQAHSGDVDVQLLLIRTRLRQDADAARKELDTLASENPFLGPVRHELLGEWARERGCTTEAEQHWVQGHRAEAEAERAREERSRVSLKDALVPHGCDSKDVETIVEWLKNNPRIREAYLVGKHVDHFPEHPVLFLILCWRPIFWDPRDRKRVSLQGDIARNCPFPAHHSNFVLVATRGRLRRYRSKLRKLGARIL